MMESCYISSGQRREVSDPGILHHLSPYQQEGWNRYIPITRRIKRYLALLKRGEKGKILQSMRYTLYSNHSGYLGLVQHISKGSYMISRETQSTITGYRVCGTCMDYLRLIRKGSR